MMRTQAHPADRRQIHVDQNNSGSTNQINLPQKRKTPDSDNFQPSEHQQVASPPVKLTLKLKVPSSGQARTLSAGPAGLPTSSSPVQAAARVGPTIRLAMPSSGVVRAPRESTHASSEVLVTSATQTVVMSALPAHPQVSVPDIARAEEALISMNPLTLESTEPALKRRKTSQESEHSEDQICGRDPEAQKEIEQYVTGKFMEALGKSDPQHVEGCIISGRLKLESVDMYFRTKALLMMISIGSREAVRYLMRSGVDMKVLHSEEGLVHLRWRISRGDSQMVRELLNGSPGAGCRFRDALINILHEVLQRGDWRQAKVLLNAGISPDQSSVKGDTALGAVWKSIVASWNNSSTVGKPINRRYLELIAKLIKAGANINQPLDRSGDTLLHKAVAGGYSAHVQWLLSMGANPEARNAKQQTPADLAIPNHSAPAMSAPAVMQDTAPVAVPIAPRLSSADRGQWQVVAAPAELGKIAIQPAPMRAQKAAVQVSASTLSLFAAASAGQTDVIRSLATARDLDINYQNEQGLTPLMIALLNGHQEVAILLLSMKANPYIVKPDTRISAFTIAAMKGHLVVLSNLLSTPEFAVLKNITGVDALCAAVEYQQIGAVLQLRHAGVSPYKVGPAGKTAMMVNHGTPAAQRNIALQVALQ